MKPVQIHLNNGLQVRCMGGDKWARNGEPVEDEGRPQLMDVYTIRDTIITPEATYYAFEEIAEGYYNANAFAPLRIGLSFGMTFDQTFSAN